MPGRSASETSSTRLPTRSAGVLVLEVEEDLLVLEIAAEVDLEAGEVRILYTVPENGSESRQGDVSRTRERRRFHT